LPVNDDAPELLNAPVRIIDTAGIAPPKATYGGVILSDQDSHLMNSNFNVSNVASTQRERRKQREADETLKKKLEEVAAQDAMHRREMAEARMQAIRAQQRSQKHSSPGAKIEGYRLPHPSGTGDLISDISLTLSMGRTYGLIGKNGVGKSSLLKAMAKYQVNGLEHLKIMLVDQHVEGDEESPMQVSLNYYCFRH
jgi:ATP-binding cassette subfamily F protein 3